MKDPERKGWIMACVWVWRFAFPENLGRDGSLRIRRTCRRDPAGKTLLPLHQVQGRSVHAITQSGWLGTIIENVAQMRTAA